MAVFLTKNAPGLRTSPVKRGYWVVRRLLGENIPAPPANVPELPDDEAKLGDLTLRETLARHRADKSCAGCHERFDAIGLAFEGYGPVGEFRDDRPRRPARRHPRDVPRRRRGDRRRRAARLPRRRTGGDEFVDNLCRKLLAYALGRSLLPSDDETIEDMRTRLAADGDRFGSLVETHRHQPAVPEQASRKRTGGGMKTMSGSEQRKGPGRPARGVTADVPPRRGRHDGPAVARVGPRLGRRRDGRRRARALPEAVRRPVHGLRRQPDQLVGQGRRRRRWSSGRAWSRWRPLKAKINVVNGLFNKHATGVGIHPGQTGNILSGAALQKGAELKGGISVDQDARQAPGRGDRPAEHGPGLRAADHRLPRDELLDGLQLAHLLAERDLAGADGGLSRRWPSTACSTTAAASATRASSTACARRPRA